MVVLLVAGLAWLTSPQPTLPEADAALASSPAVSVSQRDGRLTFAPAGTADVGLVLYPGGRVPPKAYAPVARDIAERGYLVVIVPMPLNLAVLDMDAADDVRTEHPEIAQWVVGGHSLGGAMAAQHVANRAGEIDGLVLWAAYSAVDIAASGVQAAVIFGTLDAGRDSFTAADSLARLPPGTTVVPIEGGNHAGFGWYTGQPNDPPALISRQAQQAATVEATVGLLSALSEGSNPPAEEQR